MHVMSELVWSTLVLIKISHVKSELSTSVYSGTEFCRTDLAPHIVAYNTYSRIMAEFLPSSNDESRSYQYKPLQPNGNEIRLLQIAKDDQEQAVFSLRTFETDGCPSYVVLSYMWGPPLATRSNLVDEATFTIRENLGSFFDNLTQSGITIFDDVDSAFDMPEYMWIDQLCIDQSSLSDKSLQVQRMAQIYK